MARPTKKGIDYFSFDVDFFEDEKIEPISGEFGAKGEIIVIRLLCAVYRNGYFAMWTEQLKMTLANRCKVSHELVEQVIKRLVKWNFFEESLFYSAGILTSKGIQTRYKEATRKRKLDYEKMEYWLLFDEKGVSSAHNSPQEEFLPALNTQSKVNKSNNINTSINIEDIYTKNQNFENFENSENSDLKNSKKEKEKSCAKKEKGFSKEDFKNKLLELGAELNHVEDWIKVRVSKKATFTQTALNAFLNECNKNNFPIAEAVKLCAERSWQGFKYQWILNENQRNGTAITNTNFASSESKQPYFFDRERAMQALTSQTAGGLSEN